MSAWESGGEFSSRQERLPMDGEGVLWSRRTHSRGAAHMWISRRGSPWRTQWRGRPDVSERTTLWMSI